jgi:hypothetical protein
MVVSQATMAIVVLALVTAAGCRQADGQMPVPVGEQQNKVQDLGRDLQNIADRQPDAEKDFLEDVLALDAKPRPEPVVRELTSSLSSALAGKALEESKAQGIANAIFIIAVGHEASQRQIKLNGGALRESLLSAGVDTAAADKVMAAADNLSNTVTENRKRWYHVF